MSNYVKDFASQTVIYSDTRFPIQKRGGGNPDDDRGVTPAAIVNYVVSALVAGNVQTILDLLPEYDTDADAVAALGSGKCYRASAIHDRMSNAILITP